MVGEEARKLSRPGQSAEGVRAVLKAGTHL